VSSSRAVPSLLLPQVPGVSLPGLGGPGLPHVWLAADGL